MDFKEIEETYQAKWQRSKVFKPKIDKKKEKVFVTFPIPYINGGPHIGHAFSGIRTDIYAHFKRLQGYNVLFPQGFHVTGQPILGAIDRLRDGDEVQIETFKKFGASDKDIERFKKDVKYFIEFWKNEWKENLEKLGMGIDWSRSFMTSSLNPPFSKFIEWQYSYLKEQGYVVQGSHPVIWCPNCDSPTGDHDRLEGEGASPQDYNLFKFRLETGEIVPCATLRPETIYGVTNLWIDPLTHYVRVEIDEEIWIVSKEAADKMKEQLFDMKILGEVIGQDIVGTEATNPVTNDEIMIFPADFVDSNNATGIVMSVPAHAPYDWIALQDLKRYSPLAKDIKPKKVINTDDYKGFPAEEVCKELGIVDQLDRSKLDIATDMIYKKEFHKGKMNDKTGDWKGTKVSEAKEKLTEEFRNEGSAGVMYEPSEEVICRCTTKNIVKRLEDQWFLKYSDEDWKDQVREVLDDVDIYPEETRKQFENTIDWLDDKACARRSGIGTPLPWDPEWIVETLSDSTVYMAYYTIARILNENNIKSEDLTPEVFEHVFLGKRFSDYPIKKKYLNKMRDEFEYWYPVDLRNSGKDLIQNHLLFYLFHHLAVLPKKCLPKGISVNGFVKVEGEKMSKSKGNVIPLKDAIEEHGADLVRATLATSAENMDDPDFREENIGPIKSRLEFLLEESKKKYKARTFGQPEAWIRSRFAKHVEKITKNYDELKYRSAFKTALFDVTNDIKWYLKRRGDDANVIAVKEILQNAAKLIAPVTPHVADQIWDNTHGRGSVLVSGWPEIEDDQRDITSEEKEKYMKGILSDVAEVKEIVDIKKPKKLTLFVTKDWKYQIYKKFLRDGDEKSFTSDIMSMKKYKEMGEPVTKFIQRLQKQKRSLNENVLSPEEELETLENNKEFLENELGLEIELIDSAESEHEKTKQAEPGKPGLLLE